MNNIYKISTLFIMLVMMLTSCSPDDPSMGSPDVNANDLVEGIAFKIEHDADNPNIVYLTSLMGTNYTPLWNHPQGRSQEQKVTLRMPFAGTYEVQFGVETRGGLVYGEKVTFEVKNFYAGFVENELWTFLSGGVDQEKTWYLDLDADGVSRYFAGPMFFYGTADSWETVTNGVKLPEGADSWNWSPDWKGNQWLMNAADFGTMTFNLKGGANVTVNHKTIPLRNTETGVYMLDVTNHTLKMTNASPLHDSNRDGTVVDWGNTKLLSLTENTMQLGVLRDPGLSGEGPALLVYNYISKDYYDNWTPGEVAEPEPPYNGDPNGDLATSTSRKWKLSLNSPYNYAALNGDLLNPWASPADYIATGWAPYDATFVKNVSLEMTKGAKKNEGLYTFTDGLGSPISGTYSIDDKNNIVFDKKVSFAISGWVNLATTDENMLRIISVEKNASGNIIGMWLGQRNPDKAEYMVFHFE